MHEKKNIPFPKGVDLFLEHCQSRLCFCSLDRRISASKTFLMFCSLAPSKIKSYSDILWDFRMLLSQPNAWHSYDFNSSAAQRGRLKPHAHTLTQFFDSAGQSCGFHCQSHNTRWRESNRVCKRERVRQWLEYLLGHCSWLCISPHFWMGIFSSQVRCYYRRWLEINNKSSEGSLKPHQLCGFIHCLLAREKLWNSGVLHKLSHHVKIVS